MRLSCDPTIRATGCYVETPLQTFVDSVPLAREKLLGLACAAAPAVGLGLMNYCVAQ